MTAPSYSSRIPHPEPRIPDQSAFDEFVRADGRHPELFLRWKLGKILEPEFRRLEAPLVQELTEKFHASRDCRDIESSPYRDPCGN